jgi:hypothetical protein
MDGQKLRVTIEGKEQDLLELEESFWKPHLMLFPLHNFSHIYLHRLFFRYKFIYKYYNPSLWEGQQMFVGVVVVWNFSDSHTSVIRQY